MAPSNPCRCSTSSVTAYRDDDGDWVCVMCGRQLGARVVPAVHSRRRIESVSAPPARRMVVHRGLRPQRRPGGVPARTARRGLGRMPRRDVLRTQYPD